MKVKVSREYCKGLENPVKEPATKWEKVPARVKDLPSAASWFGQRGPRLAADLPKKQAPQAIKQDVAGVTPC